MNTIQANQLVHGYLAKSGEYDKSPHFYPENKEFVKGLIQEFINKSQLAPQDLFLALINTFLVLESRSLSFNIMVLTGDMGDFLWLSGKGSPL